MRIGFVGLGAMGTPMARNLVRAGHSVAVYNRTRSRAEALAVDGARGVAATPAEAARNAEAVLTMLADDRAVENVLFDGGLAGAISPGAAHISMSTISVALSQRLAREHAARGQVYLAAPVFGRPEVAEAGKLWVVAGGDAAQVERFRPLFSALGRGLSVAGAEPWKANVVKLCGNFMIAAAIEAMGEAFALARKSGIPADALNDTLNNALFQSPLYGNYGARIAAEAFEPAGFKLTLGLKDMRLALEAAEAVAVPMPLASLVRDHLLESIAHGRADADWSAFSAANADAAGLEKAAGAR
jgi:3-hydroxyisobutyrate dehydrogenase-like beta-hydroxyacid dehydrogenase